MTYALAEIARAAKIVRMMANSHEQGTGAFGLDMSNGGREMIDAPMLKQVSPFIERGLQSKLKNFMRATGTKRSPYSQDGRTADFRLISLRRTPHWEVSLLLLAVEILVFSHNCVCYTVVHLVRCDGPNASHRSLI